MVWRAHSTSAFSTLLRVLQRSTLLLNLKIIHWQNDFRSIYEWNSYHSSVIVAAMRLYVYRVVILQNFNECYMKLLSVMVENWCEKWFRKLQNGLKLFNRNIKSGNFKNGHLKIENIFTWFVSRPWKKGPKLRRNWKMDKSAWNL